MHLKSKRIQAVCGAVALVVGCILIFIFRSSAIAEEAASGDKMLFSLSLITALVGFVVLVMSLLPSPSERKTDTHTLTLAALFAALCYIGFMIFKIDIPVGSEKTAFHLGNVFCVLAALFLGGFWGGMAGAVGMSIADLTSAYVTSAPKTFLLKLGIGLIVGLFAHKVFKISQEHSKRYITLATICSAAAGMAFNVVADPLVGYFYKLYVLGIPQDIANAWAKMGAITTLVNAIVAVICASVFYLALRPALKRSRLLNRVSSK